MDLSPGSVMAPVIAEAGEMRCFMSLHFYANYFQKGAADLPHLHVRKTEERSFHEAAIVDGSHLIHQQIRQLWKAPRRGHTDTQRLRIVHQFRGERSEERRVGEEWRSRWSPYP